jgi:uncharacterized membrane protein
MKRVFSIDFARGVVMIIMALDHVRDMIHINSITQSPTDLSTTSPALFFTRWITYLCAPIFVFLAGTSAYISLKNKGNLLQSKRFLLSRGLWLILLEFTLVNFGLFFDPRFHTLIFEVIATIGFGFIILSLLLKLKPKNIALIGLAIIFLHNLLSFIPFNNGSTIKTIYSLLFSLTAFPVASHTTFVMAYPPIPWLGIMLVGYATGKLFELPEAKRNTIFFRIGCAALLLFIILRFINIYGDPVHWSFQKSAVFTFLSFMNVTKYPPSLLFCLVTLGIMFLMFVLGEKMKNKWMNIASVYGKVPFFYFLVHFYLIHILLIALLFLQGFHWHDLDFASGTFGRPKGVQSGIPLWAVYLIWISVVIALYKPCLWYGKYKAANKNKHWWLRYI